MNEQATAPESRRTPLVDRETLLQGLQLATLWAFAVGKPLLDKAGRSVYFFLPRSASSSDIILAAVIVLIVVPAVLLGIEVLAGLASKKARRIVHITFVGLLFALFCLQIVADLDLARRPTVLLAVLAAAGLTFAFARTRFVPSVLEVLSPAVLLFLGLFIFGSPISHLWHGGNDPKAADVVPKSQPPIVMIVMDEFPSMSLQDRPGHIDPTLFPNFARLAREGTFYPNSTAAGDSTETAVPAILTGRNPEPGKPGDTLQLPLAAAFPDNIFTLLAHSYSMHVLETETELCPGSLCGRELRDPFTQRFPRLLADLGALVPDAVLPTKIHDPLFGPDANVSPQPPHTPAELFDRFGQNLDTSDGQFNFIHLSDIPHKPWLLVPPIPGPNGPLPADRVQAASTAAAADADVADRKLHLLQLGAADHLLGEQIRKLKAEHAWKRALVVVTADEGFNFRANGGTRRVDRSTIDQLAFVPLFIKAPGQSHGNVDNVAIKSIDVAPTIARMIGVRIPWKVDGVPAGERDDGSVTVNQTKGAPVTASLAYMKRRRDRFMAQWRKILTYEHGWKPLARSGGRMP